MILDTIAEYELTPSDITFSWSEEQPEGNEHLFFVPDMQGLEDDERKTITYALQGKGLSFRDPENPGSGCGWLVFNERIVLRFPFPSSGA